MIQWLMSLFRRPSEMKPEDWPPPADNSKLERAIDAVGRERAFRRAEQLGWAGANPPVYVWWQIVRQLQGERLSAGQATVVRDMGKTLGLH